MVYPRLAPVAEDLISAPASQALYKANIFVLWNAHRRTQQSDEKNVEMRVFLRLNSDLLICCHKLCKLLLWTISFLFCMAHSG